MNTSRRSFLKKVLAGVGCGSLIASKSVLDQTTGTDRSIPDTVPLHTADGLNNTTRPTATTTVRSTTNATNATSTTVRSTTTNTTNATSTTAGTTSGADATPSPNATTPASTENETTAGESTSRNRNTYFLSPNGDDGNPGTKQRPMGTLQAAFEKATPGDTIYLRGGVYRRTGSVRISGVSGTDDDWIILAGYPNERPVFSFDGPTPGGWTTNGGITFSSVKYLSVQNIAVRNSPFIGIRITSRSVHNEFKDIATHNNNLVGFAVYNNSSYNHFDNIVSANNFDRQNGGADADGMAINDSNNNVVTNSKFYYNSDDGLDLWGSRSVTVRNSISWNNGRGENGNGVGFKLGGQRKSGGHRIVRNVAFNNRQTGFDYNSAGNPMRVLHNTAWSNGLNYSFFSADHEVRNNISYGATVKLGSKVMDDHNTWNLGIKHPQFASFYPNSEKFLRLSRGSPCIDKGTKVGMEYAGEAPDLGAFEFGKSVRK